MLSFKLNNAFVDTYRSKAEPFGFNGLGATTFYRTYSRQKDDGSYETWTDVCERVINGMYSLQKDHASQNKREWDDAKAHKSAEEAFDRMFNLKWTPSGRGLWMAGTEFIHKRKTSEALLNCAFISTADIATKKGAIFNWFMEMLMLGVGVGGDTKGKGKILVNKPDDSHTVVYIVADSRRGWSNSVQTLIDSYLIPGEKKVEFDYDHVRAKGLPIKGFGGIASGPEPLKELHARIRTYLDKNIGSLITTRTIVDIFNSIGACVIAGNVN